MRALGLCLALAACASEAVPTAGARVSVAGHDVMLDADVSLRALRLDLEWDAGLAVTGFAAERMNVVRSDLAPGKTRARVVVADTRRLKLPMRGLALRVEATGSGAVRVLDAEGADDGAAAVRVEVAR